MALPGDRIGAPARPVHAGRGAAGRRPAPARHRADRHPGGRSLARHARPVAPHCPGGDDLCTGVLLFLSESVKCYYSQAFWVKITTLPLALIFTFAVRQRVIGVDGVSRSPNGSPARRRCCCGSSSPPPDAGSASRSRLSPGRSRGCPAKAAVIVRRQFPAAEQDTRGRTVRIFSRGPAHHCNRGEVSPGSSSWRCAHHGAMPLVITRSWKRRRSNPAPSLALTSSRSFSACSLPRK